MKNILPFIITLLFVNIVFSQDITELKLTSEGVEPVKVDFPDLSTNQIYDKTLMWVQEEFINPKDVLTENLENEKVKIDGFAKKAWWYKSMGLKNYNHMQYTINIFFNEGNAVFEFIVGDFYILEGPKSQYDYRMFFKKDGSIRKQYTDAVSSLDLTMNTLLISYYNYVSGNNSQVENKDLNKYLSSLQKSISKDATNPSTHFDLACFYSLIEDKDNAYEHLSKAVSYGYKKIDNIKNTPDLKWLRSQDNYKKFVANGYKFTTSEESKAKHVSTKSYIEELKEIAKLKEEGIITEDEFNELKTKIIERVKNE